jgi:hypothetical protein
VPTPAAPQLITNRIPLEDGGTATISCSVGSDRAMSPK